MKYREAMLIAEDLLERISTGCELAVIAGSLRRGKEEVHDIELVVKPRQGRHAPQFGNKIVHNTHLDKLLYELEDERRIARVMGGPRLKKYAVNLESYGMPLMANPFHVEFYIMIPPSQFGVGLVIRTGPAKDEDNFSRWCVTNRSGGGGLPNGYKVKHLGVWRVEQLDFKGEPLPEETPIQMAEELAFLDFLGLGWVEPWKRHAAWRKG